MHPGSTHGLQQTARVSSGKNKAGSLGLSERVCFSFSFKLQLLVTQSSKYARPSVRNLKVGVSNKLSIDKTLGEGTRPPSSSVLITIFKHTKPVGWMQGVNCWNIMVTLKFKVQVDSTG